MLKVKIKNIILFVMILICLHLSSNVWLRLPGFISPDAYEDNDLEDAEADIWKILKPVKSVIKYNDNYTVLYSDGIGLWEEALNVLNDAFNSPDGIVAETAAFPAEYLKFDFNTNIPVEIFTNHMKAEDDNINETVKNVKNVIIDLKNNDTIYIYNGHSYKDRKTSNTNLAILSSHNFRIPFNEPIKYGAKVAELLNMLGGGKILVQRYGDILDGKRTWQHELSRSNVKPTLPDAVAGDLTAAMPYRTMTNILNFIEALNVVVPGFAGTETLLYGPEVKFYSNKVEISTEFETNIKNLYCLGDASGWTRGLMMSSLMGVRMGQILGEKP
jgi:hypothetical protein